MADKKVANAAPNKLAMSRALGAAFLHHQVEQLEKSVTSNGPASGNWRDRKNGSGYVPPGGPKRGPNSPASKAPEKKKGAGGDGGDFPALERTTRDKDFDRKLPGAIRRSAEEGRKDKDADVVIVDASVLIHALYQVKRWCRDGREEIVIVPLEALNTLDLLKKGTSSLAQKARAASRILEAQVGTNSRIRVQRDDAFVLWDQISFKDNENPNSCPEWVRRIICCARWETENPEREFEPPKRQSVKNVKMLNPDPLKVVLAVLSSAPNLSPQSVSVKLADMAISSDSTPLTPVPLPAPAGPHANRHEARSTGALVIPWASKADIELFEVEPALPGRGEEEDKPRRGSYPQVARGRRASGGEHRAKPGLVERPPAVKAMMEMVSQPSKVVRVLARGEKLDPDP